MNIQVLADQLLLQNFSPPGVLVNDTGDIIYISGHTGKYLEPAVGKANMNIFAMLREGLRDKFPSAFRQAIMKKEVVVLQNIKVDTNGGTQILILEDKVAQRTSELEDSLLKLSQAKKELDLLSIAKSEFINMISHEIRTPLNGILGSLALIGRYNFSIKIV